MKDRCNRVHDCPHGEDELRCAGGCGPDQWTCADTGQCIPGHQVCDNVTQCHDHSDEWQHCHCYKRNMGVCQDTGECLSTFRVCDGVKDCTDGSDEKYCDTKFRTTSTTLMSSSHSPSQEPMTDQTEPDYLDYNPFTLSDAIDDFGNDISHVMDKSSTHFDMETTNTDQYSSESTLMPDYIFKEMEATNFNDEYQYATDEQTSPKYPDFPLEYLTSPRPNFGGLQALALRKAPKQEKVQYFSSKTGTIPPPEVNVRVYPQFQGVVEGQIAIIQCRDEGSERSKVVWSRTGNKTLPTQSSQASFISVISEFNILVIKYLLKYQLSVC